MVEMPKLNLAPTCASCRSIYPNAKGAGKWECRRAPPTPILYFENIETRQGPTQAMRLMAVHPPIEPSHVADCHELPQAVSTAGRYGMTRNRADGGPENFTGKFCGAYDSKRPEGDQTACLLPDGHEGPHGWEPKQ